MTLKFNVTYEIVTPDFAPEGEADDIGFICEDVSLRDAIEEVRATRTSEVDGISAIEWNGSDHRWLTIVNGMEYRTGAQESRSIHIPDNVSRASRVRIGRLLGVMK